MKTEGIAREAIAGEKAMVAQLFAKGAIVPYPRRK